MASAPARSAWTRKTGEGFQASLTDLFIGLLFLFLLLMMYFATQLRTTVDDLLNTEITRNRILEEIHVYAEARGVPVEVDKSAGVLRLSRASMFRQGRASPEPSAVRDLQVLASAMAEILPCYTYLPEGGRPTSCRAEPHVIETVFFEGHTDKEDATEFDNWSLSAARAANVWNLVENEKPSLAHLLNAPSGSPNAQTIMSVSGYGDRRPVSPPDRDAARNPNRRVDIRIVMRAPQTPEPTPPPEVKTSIVEAYRELNPLPGKPQTVIAGRTLRMSKDAGNDGNLDAGWSALEYWGVWTDRPEAHIRLPLPKSLVGKAVNIRLRGVAYVKENWPRQTFVLLANGAKIARHEVLFPESKVDWLLSAPDSATANGEIVLTVQALSPVSPFTLKESGDQRPIALGLSSLKVYAE